jgi:hypothetical protein
MEYVFIYGSQVQEIIECIPMYEWKAALSKFVDSLVEENEGCRYYLVSKLIHPYAAQIIADEIYSPSGIIRNIYATNNEDIFYDGWSGEYVKGIELKCKV